jgi:hypothetical protein
MRTDAQIQASRLNGAKSLGPVTAEGKLASSRNALKHGILAANVIIKGENEATFLEHTAVLYDEFQPATPFEESLIDTMAVARWRQERIWNIERNTNNAQMDRETEQSPNLATDSGAINAAAFRSLGDQSRALDLILRYESRYDRQYLRAHKRFIEVRNARLKSDPPPNQPLPSKPGPQLVPKNSAPATPVPEPAPIDASIFTKRTQRPAATVHEHKRETRDIPDSRSFMCMHGPDNFAFPDHKQRKYS